MGGSSIVSILPNNGNASNGATLNQQQSASPTGSGSSSTGNKLHACSMSRSASSSTLSLYSNTSSTNALISSGGCGGGGNCSVEMNASNAHYHHHHHHKHLYSHHRHSGSSVGGSSSSSGGSVNSGTGRRGKKHNWGARKRAGMSFLIVIVFVAVFAMIILTEVFMIDEKSPAGLNHAIYYGSHMGDSMPDYEEVKDDYYNLENNFWSDNKLKGLQYRDNKQKVQDAVNGDFGRLSGSLRGSINGINAADSNFGTLGKGLAGMRAGASTYLSWGKRLSAKDEYTLPPYPAGLSATDGAWQVVNGTRFKFFVFSAYYDRRDGARLVRIVGATKTRSPEHVWCRFWYLNRNASAADNSRSRYTSVTVMALVKTIRENWNLKYSACFIICPVRAPDIDVPQQVSIVARLRAPPGNLLQLRNTDWDPDFARSTGTSNATGGGGNTTNQGGGPNLSQLTGSPTLSAPPTGDQLSDKIAICVKPFHFDYDQALYLMEYLELYSLLGVSHFTFYNHTIGKHASCVLQHYMSGDIPGNLTAWDAVQTGPVPDPAQNANQSSNQNIKHLESRNYEKPTVNIMPWNLRMRSQKEIRTEGLFAALNDCLYRNMYRYKYVALVDLDEFIVPRHNDTLIELINSLNQRVHSRSTGVYSFQNAFFYLQFEDDPAVFRSNILNSEELRLRASLVTQRKTRRRSKLHPQKQRSKYICKPEAVVEAGNHFVWEFAAGKGSLNVPPNDAILQHYRVCEFGGNDCIKGPSIVDRTATKYTNRLVQRVATVYNYLKQRCQLPELPTLPKDVQQQQQQQQQQVQNQKIKSNEMSKQNNIENTIRYNNNNNDERIKTAATTHTTTQTQTTGTGTTSKKATTMNANATRQKETDAQRNEANARRRRKYIVFGGGDDGRPIAKVEYEYK